MSKPFHTISVLGDGGWGTTLAVHLAGKGFPVTLWGAFAENIEAIRSTGENRTFLPGVTIPSNIEPTSDLRQAVSSGDVIVLAVPSQYIGGVLKKTSRLDLAGRTFVSVIKGIDTRTLERMSQVIVRHLGHVPLAVLSGPTIAIEVARGIPSTAVVAASPPALAAKIQQLFHSETFRIYRNTDLTGLEMGGSLKNIIAIAAGLCDGLGYGTNTKSAILTRGLVEITRLGTALGAKKATFYGLAGLGDLATTCMSAQSRNRHVGEQLGRGLSIKDILGAMATVAEGVVTVKAVYRLSLQMEIPMPITSEIYHIIYKNKDPRKAVTDLMTRRLKAE